MATKKHSAPSGAPVHSTADGAAVTLDPNRIDVVNHAAAEIDALQRMLTRETAVSEDPLELELVLLPTLRRIGDLANVVMVAIGDADNRTEDLYFRVYGERMATGEGAAA